MKEIQDVDERDLVMLLNILFCNALIRLSQGRLSHVLAQVGNTRLAIFGKSS